MAEKLLARRNYLLQPFHQKSNCAQQKFSLRESFVHAVSAAAALVAVALSARQGAPSGAGGPQDRATPTPASPAVCCTQRIMIRLNSAHCILCSRPSHIRTYLNSQAKLAIFSLVFGNGRVCSDIQGNTVRGWTHLAERSTWRHSWGK